MKLFSEIGVWRETREFKVDPSHRCTDAVSLFEYVNCTTHMHQCTRGTVVRPKQIFSKKIK